MLIEYSLNILKEKAKHLPRKEFLDPLSNTKSRIFEITAGNGYGKTFLLNLLAYALYWEELNDKQALKSLQDSVKRYNNSDEYELAYNIQLNLPDGKILVLTKEKDRGRMIKFEGEPYMNSLTLHQQLSIVYDVPTDPSERLNAVINDIGRWNHNLFTNSNDKLKILKAVQFGFTNIRDEEKIETLQLKISNISKEIEKYKNQYSAIVEENLSLVLVNELETLLALQKDKITLELEIKKKETKLKTLDKPKKEDSKDDALIRTLMQEAASIKNNFDKTKLDFIELIDGDEDISNEIINNNSLYKYYVNCKEINLNNIIDEGDYVTNTEGFIEKITKIESQIIEYIASEENGKKFKIHNFLNDLLNQIEELISFEEDILEKMSKMKAQDIKTEIEKKLTQYEIRNFNNIKVFLRSDFKKKLRSIIIEYMLKQKQIKKENSKKNISKNHDEYYKLKADLDLFTNKLKNVNYGIGGLILSCRQSLNNLETSRLETYDQVKNILESQRLGIKKELLNDIKLAIKENESRKNQINNIINTKNNELNLNKTQLGIELDKEISTYNEKQKQKIENFIRHLTFIVQHLANFRDAIAALEGDNLAAFANNNINENRFLKVAGKIIAYSMDNSILRQDGQYLKLEYYDLLRKEFHCEGEIIIKKEDISTGLASANYLKQRIASVKNSKYVIILLDEIGNMSRQTLTEVINSIKEIENNNNLVVSLLTQPSSEGIKINTY